MDDELRRDARAGHVAVLFKGSRIAPDHNLRHALQRLRHKRRHQRGREHTWVLIQRALDLQASVRLVRRLEPEQRARANDPPPRPVR